MVETDRSIVISGSRPRTQPLVSDQQRDAALIVSAFLLFALLRIAIPYPVIDLFLHYTRPGGSALEKIHPAAYGVVLLFGIIVLSQTWPNDRRNSAIVRASVLLILAEFLTMALGVATGRTAAFSYNIDSIIQGPIVAIIMIYINRESRPLLLYLLIYFMVVNDLVVFFEAITHIRLLPADLTALGQVSGEFRPTAFLGHPLVDGLFSATSICFAWLLPWPVGRRAALSLFFLVATFAATARAAALIGAFALVACVWSHLWEQRQERKIDEGVVAVSTLGFVVAFSILILGVVAAGFADRLLKLGLFSDQSSQARFTIYRMFDYMTPKEILWGMEKDWQAYILKTYLGLNAIESPLVGYIVQFGLIGAIIVVPVLLYYFYRLASGGRSPYLFLGVGTFTAVALTNNTFSSKGPALTFITMMALGARALIDETSRAGAARRQSPVQPARYRTARV